VEERERKRERERERERERLSDIGGAAERGGEQLRCPQRAESRERERRAGESGKMKINGGRRKWRKKKGLIG
jgi:hypothetical protein